MYDGVFKKACRDLQWQYNGDKEKLLIPEGDRWQNAKEIFFWGEFFGTIWNEREAVNPGFTPSLTTVPDLNLESQAGT